MGIVGRYSYGGGELFVVELVYDGRGFFGVSVGVIYWYIIVMIIGEVFECDVFGWFSVFDVGLF